ncbi:MAG: hypothetical protein ABW065_08425 [Solirubrobacterales bacterium]
MDKATSVGDGPRFSAAKDTVWTVQDRARTGSRRGFERASWEGRQLFWSLRDRAELAGAPARTALAAVLVVLAAGAGVAALIWAAPDRGGSRTTVAEVAAPVVQPPTEQAPVKPAAPTLHGAAPRFEADAPSGGVGVDAGAATAGDSAPSTGSPTSPAGRAESSTGAADDTKISSEPGSTSGSDAAASGASARARPARGPVAGPAAVAVARRFAAAFVGYEVGQAEDPGVRNALEATTTPQLGEALLERPPRLPANVEVPQAKVLNVVPAPSREHVFPISVSLLRVGTTSELRLEMRKLKGKGWLVTNVLG